MRGTTEFDELVCYRRFVDEIVGRANARRRTAVEDEQGALNTLPGRRETDQDEALVTVTRSGGFLLRRVSTPCLPPDRQSLGVRLHDDRLEALLGASLVATLPRERPPVGWPTAAHALRRKPNALLNLAYRDQLFPRDAYRRTWTGWRQPSRLGSPAGSWSGRWRWRTSGRARQN